MTDSTGATGTKAASTASPAVSDCLGRTCLKWSADGELTALDLSLVMERLAQVDQDVMALRDNSLDAMAWASIQ
ncbi:MAG: hypothetical protein ACKOCM_04055 [Cyanobacteriota bacterium]